MTDTVQGQNVKRRERAQQVALFRYQVICPALDPELSSRARGRVVRSIAAREHTGPFGGTHRYSRDTLDRWIRRYRAGGFEGLMPSPRQSGARIDANVLELAVALKQENPGRTAAQVARILAASSGWSPSESTLLRLFHRRQLMVEGPGTGEVFGRYEADAPNQRWVGDALHGPKIGGRKVYLFAFLDDHSRLLVGYRFGFAEDTVRLAAALKPALSSRGVPGTCYVDNGAAYVDAWLLRACASLGIRLTHATPNRPQGKGKIERFFRTVRDQFLVEVADISRDQLAERGLCEAAALLELNAQFTAWVESVYHHQVHSETGQTPLDRWNNGWQRAGHGPAIPDGDALTEAFLWSQLRTVTKTATVSLHGNTYQVEAALVGRKVELVFSPFDLEHIQVRYDGRSYGPAIPHVITRHAHPKAKPETTEPVPAPSTGIAYLDLVTNTHHQHLAGDPGIGFTALYSRLTAPGPVSDATDTNGGADDSSGFEQIPGQTTIEDFTDSTDSTDSTDQDEHHRLKHITSQEDHQ